MIAQAAALPSKAAAARPAGGAGADVTVDWAVSVFSSREPVEALLAAIGSVLAEAGHQSMVLDVVVNGNPTLAAEVAGALRRRDVTQGCVRLRVWNVALGDKALAWNQTIHRLWVPAHRYLYLDGYVRLGAGALAHLQRALDAAPEALAASGLPRQGPSAAAVGRMLLEDGGLHGNVYALTAAAVAELRRIGYRLPRGLYRNDSTLGAALSFGLNLQERRWSAKQRIAICRDLVWSVPTLDWWRPAHWQAYRRRRMRQAQGLLEICAVRDLYSRRREPFEALPATTLALVENWISSDPAGAQRTLSGHRLARLALEQLRARKDWAVPEEGPDLLMDQLGSWAQQAPGRD